MAGLDDILKKSAALNVPRSEPVDVSDMASTLPQKQIPAEPAAPANLPGAQDGGRSIDRTELHTNFMDRLNRIEKDLKNSAEVLRAIDKIQNDLTVWTQLRIEDIRALRGQAYEIPVEKGVIVRKEDEQTYEETSVVTEATVATMPVLPILANQQDVLGEWSARDKVIQEQTQVVYDHMLKVLARITEVRNKLDAASSN